MQLRVTAIVRAMGLAAVWFGLLGPGGCARQPRAAAPPAPAAPADVAAVTVTPQKIELTTELPGRTHAFLIAEIRPQVNGLIQKRLFTEGADVKAGEVLYQIDPAPFQAALNTAEAALNRSQANGALDPVARRALQGLAGRQGRQPAGLRRCDQRPEPGRSRHSVLESGRGDGPHQSGVHAGHRADLRSHRTIHRDRWGSRDGVSAGGPGDHSATGSHLRRCAAVDRRVAAFEAPPARMAGSTRMGPNQNKVTLILEDGTAYAHGGDTAVPRCHGGSDDRLRHSPDRLPQSRTGSSCRACSSGLW